MYGLRIYREVQSLKLPLCELRCRRGVSQLLSPEGLYFELLLRNLLNFLGKVNVCIFFLAAIAAEAPRISPADFM